MYFPYSLCRMYLLHISVVSSLALQGQLLSSFVVYESGYQRSWMWMFTKIADQIIMWIINGLFCFCWYFSSTHSRCSIAACLLLRRKLKCPLEEVFQIYHLKGSFTQKSITLMLFQNDMTFFFFCRIQKELFSILILIFILFAM